MSRANVLLLDDVNARAVVASIYAQALLGNLQRNEPISAESFTDYLTRIVAHTRAIEHIASDLTGDWKLEEASRQSNSVQD